MSVHLPTLTRTHAQPTSHLTGTASTSATAAQICCQRPIGCDLNVMLMRLFWSLHALQLMNDMQFHNVDFVTNLKTMADAFQYLAMLSQLVRRFLPIFFQTLGLSFTNDRQTK